VVVVDLPVGGRGSGAVVVVPVTTAIVAAAMVTTVVVTAIVITAVIVAAVLVLFLNQRELLEVGR
jgi:hypothetical protein